jgi:hypothetical protein
MPDRHPTQLVERVLMAFQKGLLTLGWECPVHRLARRGQPEREQLGLGLHPAQDHPQVGEVDLALGAKLMVLRHKRLHHRPARLGPDLRPAPGHIVPDRRIRQTVRTVVIDQPGQHPASRVTPLARRVQI